MEFKSVEENLRHSFRLLAASHKSGEVREWDGLTIASVGVSFQMFNAAFLSAPISSVAEMERCIALAAVHFAARGLSWSCWICEGWLNKSVRRRAQQLFRKHQLTLAADLPGMSAERLAPPLRPLPSMEIRRVTRGPTCLAFCDIGSVCFNVPPAWFREVFEGESLWGGATNKADNKVQFNGYVGYARGEPVSTAATVVASGVAGVYNVATLPGYQRCGFGEAVVRYALEKAKAEHGIDRTVLQSSPQGIRLYERMGYRAVTKVWVFSS